MLPGGPWSAFLSNSGAEAVEAAVKLARVATGRPAIIAFRYGFHGRTGPGDGADRGEGRLPRRLRAAAGLRLPRRRTRTATGRRAAPHDPSACTCDWEAQLDLLFHQLVYPDKVAAIIVEPVIGEGGYIVPPPTFLPRLREITREHGILLIADEVQTGFGRTGEMFAVQHWDVEPDIVVMAKGIASGLPLSGILARSELMDRLPPGLARRHVRRQRRRRAPRRTRRSTSSRTRASSPTRASAARSCSTGLRRARRGPARRSATSAASGLMVAIEFVKPGEGDGRVPDPDLTKRVQQRGASSASCSC